MYVAAHILALDQPQWEVKMIAGIAQPVYTAHSEHAATVRSADETVKWYCDQSLGAYNEPLRKLLALLHSPEWLKWIGMDCSFDVVPKGAKVADPFVEEDDEHAQIATMLALRICKYRMQSMSWHSHAWPGAPALFASDKEEDREKGWSFLSKCWRAHQKLQEHAAGSLFLGWVASRSAWNTVVMAEVGEAAFGTDPVLPKADVLQTLHGFSKDIFRSFGQTKVIEHLFQ